MNRNFLIERVRRAVRNAVGNRSWLYRTGSILFNDAIVVFREGFATCMQLRRLQRRPATEGVVEPVKLSNLAHPILLRPGTDDASTVINNIIREENGQFEKPLSPATLIDAGAYIGDTTAYFLSKFPGLQAVALEPNPQSFQLAQDNLAAYEDRVTLLPYALTSTEGRAYISSGELGAQVSQSGGMEVETTTIPRLLEMFPEGRVNVLKLDVEGSEGEIFMAQPETWLPKVDCILVETHTPQITRDVLEVLSANNWTATRYRSLYYCYPST